MWVHVPVRAWVLAAVFVLWGVTLNHHGDHLWAFSRDDAVWKYMLAALCMVSVHYFPVRLSWLRLGLIIGLCAALILSIFQYTQYGRASGFTNAINYGAFAAGLSLVAICLAAVEQQAL